MNTRFVFFAVVVLLFIGFLKSPSLSGDAVHSSYRCGDYEEAVLLFVHSGFHARFDVDNDGDLDAHDLLQIYQSSLLSSCLPAGLLT